MADTLTINGHAVAFRPGQTLLAAAEAVGISIPTLCHLKGATPTGACRICVVEVAGACTLLPACSTPATAGMQVQTESPRVVEARRIWDNEVSVLAPQLCGIKYQRLEGDGLQWPCPDENHPGTCILHRDGRFTCGLGIFNPAEWTPPAEVPDDQYPLVLSTGRRLTHYHTRTQTGRCEGLNDLLGEETADISMPDARALGIADGETIRVSSRRGTVTVKARVTGEVPAGMVWMAFHFREANANWLTNAAFDNITMTAEYKACAVRIEKLKEKAF